VKAGKYKIAVRYYKRIVDYLKSEESMKDEEGEKRMTLLLAAHLNLAMCYLKLSEDLEACRSCDEALILDPKSEKGLFRRGMVGGLLERSHYSLLHFVKEYFDSHCYQDCMLYVVCGLIQ